MAVKIKASKRISPKNKSKIKRTVSKTLAIKVNGNKIVSSRRGRNVSHNKKNK